MELGYIASACDAFTQLQGSGGVKTSGPRGSLKRMGDRWAIVDGNPTPSAGMSGWEQYENAILRHNVAAMNGEHLDAVVHTIQALRCSEDLIYPVTPTGLVIARTNGDLLDSLRVLMARVLQDTTVHGAREKIGREMFTPGNEPLRAGLLQACSPFNNALPPCEALQGASGIAGHAMAAWCVTEYAGELLAASTEIGRKHLERCIVGSIAFLPAGAVNFRNLHEHLAPFQKTHWMGAGNWRGLTTERIMDAITLFNENARVLSAEILSKGTVDRLDGAWADGMFSAVGVLMLLQDREIVEALWRQ